MRLKDDQILRLAEKIFNDLAVAELITLKKDRGAVLTAMREAIAADMRVEQALERDAEALLEQTLKSVGGGQDIDRHKMLQMIKVKLAKERKIVL
jgi:hypothetical protein